MYRLGTELRQGFYQRIRTETSGQFLGFLVGQRRKSWTAVRQIIDRREGGVVGFVFAISVLFFSRFGCESGLGLGLGVGYTRSFIPLGRCGFLAIKLVQLETARLLEDPSRHLVTGKVTRRINEASPRHQPITPRCSIAGQILYVNP